MADAVHPEYVLGHAAEELHRLIKQAAFFGDLTEHTLRLAGLAAGMRVLDVGCGAGDVSLLAASMVGPSGSVVGVDQNADAIALAKKRVGDAGIPNIAFEVGDITQLSYAGEFDAVIGRLVILYLGDHVKGVTAFRHYAKPGGLIYFQEFCIPGIGASPHVPLYDYGVNLIGETFARAKIQLYLGMQLPAIYHAAGLPAPSMLGMARVETGEDSAGYNYIAQTIRSLLPLIEKLGVSTAREIDIDTFADRLKAEVVERHAAIHMPELIAAWTRVPGA